jgi:2-phospho-L-lactate transferase/gluconeogenesis factor (CofD/UPF0052 family)
MNTIKRRLSSLIYVIRPLAFTFVGVVLLSLGVALLFVWAYRNVIPLPLPPVVFYLLLNFIPIQWRGLLLLGGGLAVLAVGIWKLSGVVVIPLNQQAPSSSELVLGYRKDGRQPRVAVLSGGAGMLILAALSDYVERLTCITPLQDPVEYYYRASSLFKSQNVYYVVPTPISAKVYAELDDSTLTNIMHVDHNPDLPERHVERLFLVTEQEMRGGEQSSATTGTPATDGAATNGGTSGSLALPITRLAAEALKNADLIILGPGSLFESILPNLLIDELRTIVQQSKARKIYICNLMTEPGLTTGFSVGDHIRQIKRYGGFTPDFALVNVQRIESDVRQIYAASHQSPVQLTPEEYEETAVLVGDQVSHQRLVVEGCVVLEADLASSVIQYSASIDNPGERKAVRVLRHDAEKLKTAILELFRWQ